MDTFPRGESIENKHDKKIWWWKECIDDALGAGLKMATNEFWVYYKLRVYETHGRYGFSVASAQTLADDIGISVQQVNTALLELRRKRKIFHIVCDKKVYRNKARLDVTNKWCEKWNVAPDGHMVGDRGRKAELELGAVTESVGETTESVGETTESPLMNKYKNKSQMNTVAAEQSESRIVYLRVNPSGRPNGWKSQKVYSSQEEVDRLESMGGEDVVDFKYWKSPKFVGDEGKAKFKRTKAKLVQPDIIEDDVEYKEINGRKCRKTTYKDAFGNEHEGYVNLNPTGLY